MDGCSASNTFLNADIRSLTYGGIGGKFIKTVWPFPAAIISLSPAKKTSAAHELHDERPAYESFDLQTKARFPIFHWRISGELTYEQYCRGIS